MRVATDVRPTLHTILRRVSLDTLFRPFMFCVLRLREVPSACVSKASASVLSDSQRGLVSGSCASGEPLHTLPSHRHCSLRFSFREGVAADFTPFTPSGNVFSAFWVYDVDSNPKHATMPILVNRVSTSVQTFCFFVSNVCFC